jgi:hypothetical protein
MSGIMFLVRSPSKSCLAEKRERVIEVRKPGDTSGWTAAFAIVVLAVK